MPTGQAPAVMTPAGAYRAGTGCDDTSRVPTGQAPAVMTSDQVTHDTHFNLFTRSHHMGGQYFYVLYL